MGFWKTLGRVAGDVGEIGGAGLALAGVATGNPALARAGAEVGAAGKGIKAIDNAGKPLPIRANSMSQATAQDNARLGAVYNGGFRSNY
jgi:hypothetical protein